MEIASRPAALLLCADERREQEVVLLSKSLCVTLGERLEADLPDDEDLTSRPPAPRCHAGLFAENGPLSSSAQSLDTLSHAPDPNSPSASGKEGKSSSLADTPHVLLLDRFFNPRSRRMCLSRIMTKYYSAEVELHVCCGGVWREVQNQNGKSPEAVIFVHFLRMGRAEHHSRDKHTGTCAPSNGRPRGPKASSRSTSCDREWQRATGSLNYFNKVLCQDEKKLVGKSPRDVEEVSNEETWLDSVGVKVLLVVLPKDCVESDCSAAVKVGAAIRELERWALSFLVEMIVVRLAEAEELLQHTRNWTHRTHDRLCSTASSNSNFYQSSSIKGCPLQQCAVSEDSCAQDVGWGRLIDALQSHIWPGYGSPFERKKHTPSEDDRTIEGHPRLDDTGHSDLVRGISNDKARQIVCQSAESVNCDRVLSKAVAEDAGERHWDDMDDLDKILKKVQHVQRTGKSLPDEVRREMASKAIVEVMEQLNCREEDERSESSEEG